MDLTQAAITGSIAGLTIFISLPAGRMRNLSNMSRGLADGLAVGILAFLFFDVVSNTVEPIDSAISAQAAPAYLYMVFALLCGFGISYLGLAYYAKRLHSERASDPFRLSLLIAVGIGLHNFGEGLAIGASASAGLISLAILLVIGFA
ncbi:MAG: zinc permease, partial [Nitrososphaerota archaeon]|nr:zinc permease [Nitrososphaerota archaeon]